MKRLYALASTLFLASLTAQAQIPGISDHWWDVISTNGQTIFMNTDKVWRSGSRAFAVIRMAPVVNGHADYTQAPDQVAATDCRSQLKVFSTNDDYEHAPLQPTGGLGMALASQICKRAH